jgi:hypothetical protein
LTSICENRSFIAFDGDVEAFVVVGDCAASSAFQVSADKTPLFPQFPEAEEAAEAEVLDETLNGFAFWVTPVAVFVEDDFDDVSDDNRSSAVDAAPAKARYMAILPPPRMRGPRDKISKCRAG